MGKKIMYKKGGKKRLKKLKKLRRYNTGGMYDNAPPQSFLPVQNIVYDESAQDSVGQYENELQQTLSNTDWMSAIEHDEMMRKQSNQQIQQSIQGALQGQNMLQNAPEFLQNLRGKAKTGFNKIFGGGQPDVSALPSPTSSIPAPGGTPGIDTSSLVSDLPSLGTDSLGAMAPPPTTGAYQMGATQTTPNVLPEVNLSASAPTGYTPTGPTQSPLSLEMAQVDQIPTGLSNELPPMDQGLQMPGATPPPAATGGGMQKLKDFANKPIGKWTQAGLMGVGLLGTGFKKWFDDNDATTLSSGEKWGAGMQGFSSGAGMGSAFGPLGLLAGGAIGAFAARKAQNKLRDRFKKSHRNMQERRGRAIQNLAMAQGAAKEYSGYDTGYGMGGYLRNMYPHGGYHKDSNTVGTTFNPVGHPNKRRTMYEHGGPHGLEALQNSGMISNPYMRSNIGLLRKQEVDSVSLQNQFNDRRMREMQMQQAAGISGQNINRNRITGNELKGIFRGGGYKYLKGGVAKPLPGGAVEFLGKTHEQGGIHLDPQTEVEDKETMDKVNGRDYFFSSHLKLGGMPYSEVHKNILRYGGDQDAINNLAAMQEEQSGRRRLYRTGGFKYHAGGLYHNINHKKKSGKSNSKKNSTISDKAYANMKAGFPKKNGGFKYENGGELPVASLDFLKEQGIIPGQQGSFTWNNMSMYGDDQIQKLIADSEGNFGTAFMNRVDPQVLKEAGINSFEDLFTGKYTDSKGRVAYKGVGKYQDAWNKLNPDNPIIGDSLFGEQTIRTMKKQDIAKLDVAEIDKLPTGPMPEPIFKSVEPMEEAPIEDPGMPKVPWHKKVPWGAVAALGAGALQLLPAIKASKDQPDYMTGVPLMPKSRLDRVRLTHARDNVRNQFHSMSKSIDDSGLGPAGIAAKMAAYGKQTDAISKIDQQEKTMNVGIDTKEKKMNQYTNMFNIKNQLAVDEFNRAADAATKDRKLGALQAGVQGFTGVVTDVLKYKAQDKLAQAMSGDSGTYDRDKTKDLWKRVKHMERFQDMDYDTFYDNYTSTGKIKEAKKGGYRYSHGGPHGPNPSDDPSWGPGAGVVRTPEFIHDPTRTSRFNNPELSNAPKGNLGTYVGEDEVDLGNFNPEASRTADGGYSFRKNLNAAMLYDPYANKGSFMGPKHLQNVNKGYSGMRFDYGQTAAGVDEFGQPIPQSGEFMRRYNPQYEKYDKYRGGRGDQPVMSKWNDPNPVVYSENAQDGKGGYVVRDRDEGMWEEGAAKNLGTLPGEGFTSSQIGRIGSKRMRSGDMGGAFTDRKRGPFSGLFGSASGSNLNISGRQAVKGQVKGYVEGDQQSTNAIEKYLEGKDITKTTRRDKGSLNIMRDKVKDKGKGFVRKTGEGFLGMQNRKKYIDGVEQDKKFLGLFSKGGYKYPTGGFNLGKPMMDPNAGMTSDTLANQSMNFGNAGSIQQKNNVLTQNRIANQDYVSGRTYPELINQYNKTGIYTSGSGGTLSAPKHIEQQRAMMLSNPIGSMIEGGRVIGTGVASLLGGKKEEVTMRAGGYKKLKKRKKRIYG